MSVGSSALLDHVNEETASILAGDAADADKLAQIQTYVDTNRSTGSREILRLAGVA